MFLSFPNTKTSLTFLTAIMDLEILNHIWNPFLQKIPVKSSVCREDCGQSEINLTKRNDFFVPKKTIYRNLSHFLHRYYRMRDKWTYLQPIF